MEDDSENTDGWNWRDLLINLAVVALGFALAFVLLEVGLRYGAIPYNNYLPVMCEGEDRTSFHPVFGWTGPPNGKYLERKTPKDDWSYYSFNSEGFRDTYDSGEEEGVIVLGDSFTRGALVDDNATFSHLLDRWTSNTSFHNFGIRGYGTDQSLLVYRNYSKSIDHDTVILGYMPGNDMRDNLDSYFFASRPQFKVVNGTPELVKLPSRDDRKEKDERGLISNPWLQIIQDYFRVNTYSYGFLRQKVSGLIRTRKDVKKTPPQGTKLEKQVNLTRALLEELGREADSNQADLVLVYIPVVTQIDHSRPGRFTYEDGKSYWNLQKKLLRQVAGNNSNVGFLDLQPAFEEERMKGNRLYGEINGHADDYGHRVMAREIYDFLVKEEHMSENPGVNFSKEYGREITECPGWF